MNSQQTTNGKKLVVTLGVALSAGAAAALADCGSCLTGCWATESACQGSAMSQYQYSSMVCTSLPPGEQRDNCYSEADSAYNQASGECSDSGFSCQASCPCC
jgi:hypothetical protein